MIVALIMVLVIGLGAIAAPILLILALIFWKRRKTRIALLASAGACLLPLVFVFLVGMLS